ncbi:hypothetical protein F5B21DRAFT_171676 [Xylaria acuta]|nr:hypothetical protein F5B21DRAFT_171676 [Xylaria acuta]
MATGETTASIATKSATANGGTTAHTNTGGIGARPGEMTGLSAVVAATIAATGTAQTESRTIGLNMTQSLAVVALLSLRRSRKGALVGFMAFSPKGDLCSRGAQRRSKPRRSGQRCHTCSMLCVIGKTWRRVCESVKLHY